MGKLSDYVNLELTRMWYMAKQNKTMSKAVKKLEKTGYRTKGGWDIIS